MPDCMERERCQDQSGPPCDALISDPLAVLADPDRWPKHRYCEDVARDSTYRWAERRARLVYGNEIPDGVAEWASSWPLPVCRGESDVPDILLPLPPAVPTAYFPVVQPRAALILEPEVYLTDVTGFGMVDARGERSPMLFDMAGRPSDDAERFVSLAARWWSGDNATGRRRRTVVTPRRAARAYRDFSKQNGWTPDQSELAAELNVTTRTLRSTLGNWSDFERDVLAVHYAPKRTWRRSKH